MSHNFIAEHTAAINSSAGRNGAKMLRGGHPIVDVVAAYGDVCQAVTALAAEARVPISAADFCLFNRCLDAIWHAVSESNRITEETRAVAEIQRLGFAAHERDQRQTAQLSPQALKMFPVPIEGLSGQMLDRALGNLSMLIERTLADVRLAAGVERRKTTCPSCSGTGFMRETYVEGPITILTYVCESCQRSWHGRERWADQTAGHNTEPCMIREENE
jgi:hypothetical protein